MTYEAVMKLHLEEWNKFSLLLFWGHLVCFFLRFWCQTEPYENTFDSGFEEQFLLIHTSMRVFVLYFLGGGGGGWSRAARGRSVVLATYIRDSSAEIDYQLTFSISLSFAKIYYILSTHCPTPNKTWWDNSRKSLFFSCHPGKNWNRRQMNARFSHSPLSKVV